MQISSCWVSQTRHSTANICNKYKIVFISKSWISIQTKPKIKLVAKNLSYAAFLSMNLAFLLSVSTFHLLFIMSNHEQKFFNIIGLVVGRTKKDSMWKYHWRRNCFGWKCRYANAACTTECIWAALSTTWMESIKKVRNINMFCMPFISSQLTEAAEPQPWSMHYVSQLTLHGYQLLRREWRWREWETIWP